MDLITIFLFFAVSSAVGQVQEEGDPCNDGTWTCRYYSECKTADLNTNQGRRPEVCSYDPDTDETIVCCPPDSGPKKRISLRKCEEYKNAVFVSRYNSFSRKFEKVLDCGPQTEQLIVGGKDAALKEFPHQAHIGYGTDVNKIRWSCGGSLISDRWILSAGHCTNTSSGNPKWARLGELDYNSDTEGADPKIIRISRAINHPEYKPKVNLYNDIALYELAESIRLTPHIRPACLQQPDSQNSDLSAIASGWGHTAWAGRPSSKLQKVNLDYVSNARCSSYYAGQSVLPDGIRDSQVCAGNKFNKDTCQGDSGGPLQRYLSNAQCMYELVGVTSFGAACGSSIPGVYSRVSFFVPWIEAIVWPES